MAQRKHTHHEDRIKREEIRSQCDHKIRLGDDHMAAGRSDFHLFDFPAK